MPDFDSLSALAVRENGLATVSIARADGTVQASVVNAGPIPDPVSGVPSIGFVAIGGAHKLTLLRRNPAATVVFRRGWQWAAAQGPVRLIGPDDPDPGFDPAGLPRLLRHVFVAATGSHDDWAEYDRVMAAERRVAVFVAATRITGAG